jgi:hypothetical protein
MWPLNRLYFVIWGNHRMQILEKLRVQPFGVQGPKILGDTHSDCRAIYEKGKIRVIEFDRNYPR